MSSGRRQDEIHSRWRDQGFLVIPNGAHRSLNVVTREVRIGKDIAFHADVTLLNPAERWYVIFTDDDLELKPGRERSWWALLL